MFYVRGAELVHSSLLRVLTALRSTRSRHHGAGERALTLEVSEHSGEHSLN